jgi:hypothetical protein
VPVEGTLTAKRSEYCVHWKVAWTEYDSRIRYSMPWVCRAECFRDLICLQEAADNLLRLFLLYSTRESRCSGKRVQECDRNMLQFLASLQQRSTFIFWRAFCINMSEQRLMLLVYSLGGGVVAGQNNPSFATKYLSLTRGKQLSK